MRDGTGHAGMAAARRRGRGRQQVAVGVALTAVASRIRFRAPPTLLMSGVILLVELGSAG